MNAIIDNELLMDELHKFSDAGEIMRAISAVYPAKFKEVASEIFRSKLSKISNCPICGHEIRLFRKRGAKNEHAKRY